MSALLYLLSAGLEQVPRVVDRVFMGHIVQEQDPRTL